MENTEHLDTIKSKINCLNSTFNSLEIDGIKLGEIMSREKSKEFSNSVRPALKQYKFELQGKKYYKLVTNEVKLENVFGTFSCFDYDFDNMKVDIVFCLELTKHFFTLISTLLDRFSNYFICSRDFISSINWFRTQIIFSVVVRKSRWLRCCWISSALRR